MEEAGYVDEALAGPAQAWDADALSRLSALQVPDAVLGRRRTLLRADAGQQWAQWFVEGLVDPRRYLNGPRNYARVFADVLAVVNERFPAHPRNERQRLASSVSQSVQRTVELLSQSGKRTTIDRSQKSFLIEIAGDPARCWICGTPFDDTALDNFLYAETQTLPTSAFVDVLKPRGLSSQDGSVQIDHVLPVALGGSDTENLALACGWCNRSKSQWTSIYDVEGRPRLPAANTLGLTSLPQPFWVVRQLGVVKRCEHLGGCDRNVTNAAMTVGPAVASGALNPENLVTTCSEHDPLRMIRLQAADAVRALWRKGGRAT